MNNIPICFACGATLVNPNFACPTCGYKFTAGDALTCPNKSFGTCNITGNFCKELTNYFECPIKIKADKEEEFPDY